MFTVRPYTIADYEDFVRIDAATRSTEYWGEADWQPIHPPCANARTAKRYVVVDTDSGQTVGYGAVLLAEQANLDVLIHPNWQRQGAGTALWEQMRQDLAACGAVSVGPWVRVENQNACRWLEALGFSHVQEHGAVQLWLSEANVSRFDSVEDTLVRQDIAITTLAAEQANRPDCREAFYALYQEVEKDVPGYTSAAHTSYEECMQHLTQPGILPESIFIATHDQAYVGLSILGRRVHPDDLRFGGPGSLSQHLTGVRAEYRRRGIALALKLRTMRYAQQHGFERIISNSDNPGMQALNRKLGFRSGPWLVYQKRLE